MNKVLLTLVLALTFISAYASYADIGRAYRDFYRHYRKYQDRQFACNNAIVDVNAAISQLFFDVKMQNNQWIIYADLDSLDESSYYLIRTCPLQTLELANLQQEVTQTPSQACSQIMDIIGSILAHDGAHDFRAGYERGVELSVAALDAGKELDNGCNIVLRQAQPVGIQQGENSNGGAESDNNEGELSLNEEGDGSEEAEMIFDVRILASNAADNESDDSDGNKEDSDDNSDDKSDDNNEDQNASSDGNSDESSDEDSDTEDDDSNGSISWNGSQGFRVKFSKTKDGHKDDYTISYDPKNGGFSMKKSESDDEEEDANEEEGSVEEANNEEGDNNEEGQDLSSLITGLYSNDRQGGNYNNNYDNNHNYNGDHGDIITVLYYL